ncbi:glycosyltransferase [Nitratireductor sp. StC3]|uniref:glycosyltransferase n=1 Tax=Nitratireductor sp. StC3 TaxID=2126741 RepID=UPI001304F746|nr:glycosyltransferase [Nitratireductor sp. StC3]
MVRPPELTVVIAVYRCAASLEELYRRGNAALQAAGHSAEWVFVDDASPDDAWCVLQSLCRTAKNVGAIRFERNCGQHAAIRAGIAMARTPWTAVIDGDLEDRPEFLVDLLEEAKAGHDVVCAATPSRGGSPLRRLGSFAYRRLVGLEEPPGWKLRVFSVISARARKAYLADRRSIRSYLLVFAAAGFEIRSLPCPVETRKAGRSSYGVGRLMGTAGRNLLLFRRRLLLGALGAVLLLIAGIQGLAGSTSLPGLSLSLGVIFWIATYAAASSLAGRWTGPQARSCARIGNLTPRSAV